MADMFDYLIWRGDLTFRQSEVNEVDALVFSGLAYIDWAQEDLQNCETLAEAASVFLARGDCDARVRVKKDLELLRAAAA